MASAWYVKIGEARNRGEKVILHLMDIPAHGENRPKLESVGQLNQFLTDHPEIQEINVYDSRFPRRPFPVSRCQGKLLQKLFS